MTPINWDSRSGEFEISGRALEALRCIRARLRDFAGLSDEASFLLPRWLFLRLIGIILVCIFVDYARFGQGMVGPGGLLPYPELLGRRLGAGAGPWPMLELPTVLWLGSGAPLLSVTIWAGLAVSVLLVLNVWPRAMAACAWIALLSVLNVSGPIGDFQHDNLISESLFLAFFLAPRGFRPGLGQESPPRPLALFLVRWLLLRLMLGSGIAKLASGDLHWRDFTAMDIHQEKGPFPTFLGYLDHQLPHWFHLGEYALTFLAELVAPVLLLCGRAGRISAVLLWTALQLGITATGNFGFLNLNGIALGLLLLDDRILGRAAGKARVGHGGRFSSWVLVASGVLSLGLFPSSIGLEIPSPWWPLRELAVATRFWRLGTAYALYDRFLDLEKHVEILASNDSGKTWRSYPFRYIPQDTYSISRPLGPYFTRFEAGVRASAVQPAPNGFIMTVGAGLLLGRPEVLGLFAANPFPDHPPDRVIFPLYEYRFTDFAEYRSTGRLWKKTYLLEQAPELHLNRSTGLVEAQR